MKKRLLSLLLCLVMVLTLTVPAYAASDEATEAAQKLYELGLFNGTGKDASGNPIFSLDLVPSRNQAVAMLVRLLGKAEEAENGQWTTPFTDVADWVKPYIGYAYANGLTNGTTATTYSGGRNTTVLQYLTFILRALGYQSGVDFEYSKACEFADSIGLTNGQYTAQTANFKRSDIAKISYDALYVFKKGSSKTLGETLAAEGVISLSKYIEASPSPVTIKNGAKYYPQCSDILSFDNVCPAARFHHASERDDVFYQTYSYNMINFEEADKYAKAYSDYLVANGYTLVSVGENHHLGAQNNIYSLVSSDGKYKVSLRASGVTSYTVTVAISAPSSESSGGSSSDGYSNYKDVPDYGMISDDTLLLDKGNAKVYTYYHYSYQEYIPMPDEYSTKMSDYISALEEHGYTKTDQYTEKCETSRLTEGSQYAYVFKNAAGREVHLMEIKDMKTRTAFIIISIDKEIKKPLVAEAISTVVAQQNVYEDPTCPYKEDDNNYKYGCTSDIYGSPIYVRKADVETSQDFLKFLQHKYDTLYSPMEDVNLEISLWGPSAISGGNTYTIHVDFYYLDTISPRTFARASGYTEDQKEETIEMLKDMMREMSQDAIDCFPDATVNGSIYVDYYRYPHIKVDYFYDQTMSWTRTGDNFRWVPSQDTFSLYN